MTLHTVGPESLGKDEQVIGKAYQTWLTPLLVAVPVVVAYNSSEKWVIATGFAIALPMLHEIGGRLHDLCIRIRRTNLILLQQGKSSAIDFIEKI